MKSSPYENISPSDWKDKTCELIEEHPIPTEVLVSSVLDSWEHIHGSKIGDELIIGENYFPTPQILGDFLHELVPVELAKHDKNWRKGTAKTEKDVVYDEDDAFSFEIKSSSQKDIYGNRSYAKKGDETKKRKTAKKSKSGYYLAVNFPPVHKDEKWAPIKHIRFGWLDEEDWHGQESESGQQASLSADVLNNKLITLYQED